MAAFWIAHVTVTNEEEYMKYAKLAGPAIALYDGEFLARGGKYIQMEGTDHARNVVVRFPSVERAHECYQSAEYQEALSFAKDASIRDLVIVEALD